MDEMSSDRELQAMIWRRGVEKVLMEGLGGIGTGSEDGRQRRLASRFMVLCCLIDYLDVLGMGRPQQVILVLSSSYIISCWQDDYHVIFM